MTDYQTFLEAKKVILITNGHIIGLDVKRGSATNNYSAYLDDYSDRKTWGGILSHQRKQTIETI